MLKILALSALVVAILADRDDPDNDEPPSGNCKPKCAPARCRKWKVDDHPCASLEISKGMAIDPWRCGEPRCQETSCDKCGDQALCVDMCLAHKADMVDKGYDLSSGFPNCVEVCNESEDPDWKCFEDTCFPDRDDAGKPMCYEYFKCSEAYCSARGRQFCYAKDNYFDPWGDAVGDPCKITQCRRCAAQSKCMDFCTAWNDRKIEEDKVNCRAECKAVEGWGCYFTPAPQDEEEAQASLKGHVTSATKGTMDLKYPITAVAFMAIAGAAYLYRKKTAKYTAI